MLKYRESAIGNLESFGLLLGSQHSVNHFTILQESEIVSQLEAVPRQRFGGVVASVLFGCGRVYTIASDQGRNLVPNMTVATSGFSRINHLDKF